MKPMKMFRFAAVAALGSLAVTAAQAEKIAITGGTVHTMGDAGVIENGIVLIDGATIRAVGRNVEVPGDYRVIDATGKWVTPGLMSASSTIGIEEVSAVPGTVDHTAREASFGAAFDISYGLNPSATNIPVTRIEGVTRAVVIPGTGKSIFAGQAAVIHLGDARDILVKPGAAMGVDLGEGGAGTAGGARGAAWVYLENAFREAGAYAGGRAPGFGEPMLNALDAAALVPVIEGDMPLLVSADRASDLRQILRLKKRHGDLKIILLGASEGWMVGEELAAADIPVILFPFANLPGNFENLGATMRNAARLNDAGVTIAIAGGNFGIRTSHNARLMRQLAGTAVANGLPWEAAMAAVTVNPARIFGIDDKYGTLERGKEADVVVWDGDPLELMVSPDAVIIRGQDIPLVSRQTKLRDRYMNLQGEAPFAYRK